MAVFIVTLTVATIRPLPIAMTSTSAMPVTSLTGPTYSCADVREPHRNLHRSSVIEMTVLLSETAGKPKTSETEVRLSRRLFVFVVLGTLVVELVATWTTSKSGRQPSRSSCAGSPTRDRRTHCSTPAVSSLPKTRHSGKQHVKVNLRWAGNERHRPRIDAGFG